MELGGGVSLVAARTVTSVRDLHGALIAVDATDSGFALLLYELLAQAGMVRGQDYRVVAFGGTPRRFDGLIHGDFDATMLNAGFDLRAADRGFPVLKAVSEVLPDYIATVIAALPCWLEKESAAGAFLRAWDRATSFALDRDNSEICVDIVKEQSAVSAGACRTHVPAGGTSAVPAWCQGAKSPVPVCRVWPMFGVDTAYSMVTLILQLR